MQQCAETLGDPVWLGYAAWLRGAATGQLNRAAHYRRSVTATESLTSMLDSSDALQACGEQHLSAALAAGAQADHDTAATHLAEASTLAARMDTEMGTWAHLWFGPTTVGIWTTSIALELREPGQVLKAAKTVRPNCCPPPSCRQGSGPRSARPWSPRRQPGTRPWACCCTPSGWPRSGSART